MFIVSLTYIASLEEVDKYLALHVSYLEEQYVLGNFIASGRKVPRTGGIILSKMDSLENLQAVLEKDPFKMNDLAAYEIQEFMPTMTAQGFENLKD
ncbi:GTP cyclohydrolase [bacterium]|nr:GTP cyclohydrolase [bacterium]MBU1883265.1 GTP cyclohydrolase [bacterium]